MGGEKGGEDKGFNRHKLDEDVEGGARRILQRVSNGVTDNSSLVRVRTFRAKGPGVLRSSSLSKPTIIIILVNELLLEQHFY